MFFLISLGQTNKFHETSIHDMHGFACVCVLNKTNINPIKVAGKFPYHLLRHDVEIPQMGQPDRSLALSTPHSIHSSYFGLEASESTKTSLKKCNSCKTATRDLKMSIKLENLENPLKKQIFPVALPEKKHGNYFHMFSKGICHKNLAGFDALENAKQAIYRP